MTFDTSKFTAAFGTDIFHMPGTEGTGKFIVVVVTDRGRVGYRDHSGNGDYRVRVEPLNAAMADLMRSSFPPAGSDSPESDSQKVFAWKVPGMGGEDRFSTTCKEADLKDVLEIALTALVGVSNFRLLSTKDNCPVWAKDLVGECIEALGSLETLKRGRLITRIRNAKLPGCNACSRWSTATLQRKIAEVSAS